METTETRELFETESERNLAAFLKPFFEATTGSALAETVWRLARDGGYSNAGSLHYADDRALNRIDINNHDRPIILLAAWLHALAARVEVRGRLVVLVERLVHVVAPFDLGDERLDGAHALHLDDHGVREAHPGVAAVREAEADLLGPSPLDQRRNLGTGDEGYIKCLPVYYEVKKKYFMALPAM